MEETIIFGRGREGKWLQINLTFLQHLLLQLSLQ